MFTGGTSLRSQATKVHLQEKLWKPILSLVNSNETSSGGNAYGEEIRATCDVFLKGLFRGLSGKPATMDSAPFIAGRIQHLGVYLEGTAMGLALCDRLTPARFKRWNVFKNEIEQKHPYEIHTALGMALGMFGGKVEPIQTSLWNWFIIDGLGFQQGLLHPDRYIERKIRSRRALSVQASRVFDQGLGRAIWFHAAGDVVKVSDAVEKFESDRKHDLWVGIGVAAAHVGSLPDASLSYLEERAGFNRAALAIGIAIAAHVRFLNETGKEVAEAACRVILSTSAHEAAMLVEEAANFVKAEPILDRHAHWQNRIAQKLGIVALN